jgi:hypothetical protein
MELLSVVFAFLSPYLVKAGEKVSEETVKTLFESRQDLAKKFKGLFQNEIITLGLNETFTAEKTTKLIEAKPEVKEDIRKKIEANRGLFDELVNALKQKDGGININAKNIGQVINNPSAPITQTNKFN